jgi:hypothetical protein
LAAVSIDLSAIERWRKLCETAPDRSVVAMRRAVNDAGNAARTQVYRTLAKQMGLLIS